MELSTNFLVTLIIMTILLVLGISLFFNIIHKVDNVTQQVYDDEKAALDSLLIQDNLISILTSESGEINSAIRFPIAIINEKGSSSNSFEFTDISCQFTANNDSIIASCCSSDIYQFPTSPFEIANNDRIYRTILVTPKCSDGFYTFKFGVTRDGHYYGKNQTLWVTVN